MPLGERFADPLSERLAAFVRGIGIEVRAAAGGAAAILRMSCAPRISAESGVAPFPHIWRWLR